MSGIFIIIALAGRDVVEITRALRNVSFNPRAHAGRDIHLILYLKYTYFFGKSAQHSSISTLHIQLSKNNT